MECDLERRSGAALAVMQALSRITVVKRQLSPKGKALDLIVDLCSSPHLWPRALGSDPKNGIGNTSSQNEFPP